MRYDRFVRLHLGAIWLCAGCYFEPEPPIFHNTAFVTSQAIPAKTIANLDAADALCNSSAAAGHQLGHYVAWLSTASAPAATRLGLARGWVRPDDKPFADQATDILTGHIYYPLRLDENGRDVVADTSAEQTPVATGTQEDGMPDGHSCDTSGDIMFGWPDGTTTMWTAAGRTISCDVSVRLYCFSVDITGGVAPADSGRLAFVTNGDFTPGNGVTPADDLCAAEAAAAGVAGNFAALLGTVGATPASRISKPNGTPWVRPDHVVVTSDLTSFVAPPNVTLDGRYRSVDFAWSGALSPQTAATPSTTCSDWTDGSATSAADGGRIARSSRQAFSDYVNCNESHPIYCFER